MAIRLPVVSSPANGTHRAEPPLKTVISPRGLFQKETTALTSAILKARFNSDGSIATGAERIVSAAEAAQRAAGTRYTLTIYVKVAQKLKDDESGSLGKKVQAINDLLARPADAGKTDKPQT